MPTALDRFFEMEREKYGEANYYFKGDKKSSAVRAFYARPFCPEYMYSFSTTMYPNTFFAEKKRGRMQSCLETEYHENVHKWDRCNEGIKMYFKYAWPHWMAIPFLLAVVALSGWYGLVAFGAFVVCLHIGLGILAIAARYGENGVPSGGAAIPFYVLGGLSFILLVVVTVREGEYWAFLWLGFLLFVSPWPIKPFWRRNYELRGYTMSLYRIWKKYKDEFDEGKFNEAIEWYVQVFAGPDYVFMETDRNWVRKEFLFQYGRMQFSEEAFLKNWIWRDKMKHPSFSAAEPFRMAKRSMDREYVGD